MGILNVISWSLLVVGILLVGVSFIGAMMCAASEQGTNATKYYRWIFFTGLTLIGLFFVSRFI